jgi:hypothetical protein
MACLQLVERSGRVGKSLPTEPGEYYWTEWACMVRVYCKTKTYKPGGRLYVKLPGGIEVRITPRIAGSFRDIKPLRGTT